MKTKNLKALVCSYVVCVYVSLCMCVFRVSTEEIGNKYFSYRLVCIGLFCIHRSSFFSTSTKCLKLMLVHHEVKGINKMVDAACTCESNPQYNIS